MLTGLALAFALAQALPVVVLKTEFIVFEQHDPEGTAVSTRRVPYRPDSSCFAWILRVEPAPRRVAVREVFTLPAAPKSWGVSAESTQVSNDRRRAETDLDDDIADGMIGNEWCVAEGDPLGRYRIEVFEGARLLHRFDFAVVAETA